MSRESVYSPGLATSLMVLFRHRYTLQHAFITMNKQLRVKSTSECVSTV